MVDASDVQAYFDAQKNLRDDESIVDAYREIPDKESAIPVTASTVRYLYKNGEIDIDMANTLLSNWRDDPSYLGFKVETDEGVSYEYIKASKRGNDVHKWRVCKRFRPILNLCAENEDLAVVRECPSGHRTQILKFTLTADPKKYDRDEFNENVVSDELDRWMNKFIRREIDKDAEYLRSYEVHKGKNKGYIHVNVTIVFPNRSFKMAWYDPKEEDKHSRWILQDRRIKNKFTDAWRCGHADVRGLSDVHSVAEYAIKYYIKDFTSDAHREMQNLTNSVLTLHNKRSFAISGSFQYSLERLIRRCGDKHRLDTCMHNSPTEAEEQSGGSPAKYTFLGVYGAGEIGISGNIWLFIDEHPPPDIADKRFKMQFVELASFDYRYHIPQ